MKLKTDFWLKPIPDRQFDWSCVDDDTYDGPGCPIGYGPTEQAARDDLLEQIAEKVDFHDLLDIDENGQHDEILVTDPASYAKLCERVKFWCGKFGVHYCFECGNAVANSDEEWVRHQCPDHMRCSNCR